MHASPFRRADVAEAIRETQTDLLLAVDKCRRMVVVLLHYENGSHLFDRLVSNRDNEPDYAAPGRKSVRVDDLRHGLLTVRKPVT